MSDISVEHTPRADPVPHLDLIEEVLGRYNIRVVVGPSPRTGHPVLRLIDRATGRLSQGIPAGAGRDLARIATLRTERAASR